jgi:glutathione S-transferase
MALAEESPPPNSTAMSRMVQIRNTIPSIPIKAAIHFPFFTIQKVYNNFDIFAIAWHAYIEFNFYKRLGWLMLELIVYPKTKNEKLLNNSPFCAKTENFLKFTKIEYTVNNFNADPSKFKNSKLPVINSDGDLICDSSVIEKFLIKKYDLKLDEHLTESEHAIGYALTKLVEDSLYWSLLHERWFIDKNWEKLKMDYFGHMPFFIRFFVPNLIQKSVLKAAKGHGISRHSDAQVHSFGVKAIHSISNFLGTKKFLFGDKVSTYDITIYSFISNIIHSPYGPKLAEHSNQIENLTTYDQSMYRELNG